MFYNAIHSQYPNAVIISTISINGLHNATAGIGTDDHIYVSAAQIVARFNAYDNAPRQYPIFVAEYAAIHGTVGESPSGQLENPTLESATAEAVMLLGCERNSDAVAGTSYGALIKSLDEAPDNVAVIKHNADSIVLSFSYYVQKMFATYYGTKTASTTSKTPYGPLYWSTTVSDKGQYYVKIVNFNGTATTTINVNLIGSKARKGKLVSLTGLNGPGSVNGLGNTQSVWKETAVSGKDGKFSFLLEGSYASAVLVV
jgi:alpha-L-arabinofuranosidase